MQPRRVRRGDDALHGLELHADGEELLDRQVVEIAGDTAALIVQALDLAVRAAKGWLDSVRATVPYFRAPRVAIQYAPGEYVDLLDANGNIRSTFSDTERDRMLANVSVNTRTIFSWFGIWLSATTQARVDNLVVTYEAGRTVAVTTLVQPPSVEVDPPPFVYVAPSNTDVRSILGQLTIVGGDSVEGAGDLLVVHNQSGVSTAARLVTRVAQRVVQVGVDQRGNAIWQAEVDSSTGAPIYDSALSLEGMGLPTGTGADGTQFFGIELSGFERLDLRLAGGNDRLTVAMSQYRGVRDVDQVLRAAQVPTGLDTPTVRSSQIVAGAGNDVIDLLSYRGRMTVLGGAGNDTVNVGNANLLNGVLGTLLFDGDAHIREEQRQATSSDFPASILAARLGPRTALVLGGVPSQKVLVVVSRLLL